jgi:hypothetical protein
VNNGPTGGKDPSGLDGSPSIGQGTIPGLDPKGPLIDWATPEREKLKKILGYQEPTPTLPPTRVQLQFAQDFQLIGKNLSRVGGLIRVVGGAFAIFVGITTSPTGIGGLAALKGLDELQAGVRTLVTGKDVATVTADVVQWGATKLGADEATAEALGKAVDGTLDLLLPATASAKFLATRGVIVEAVPVSRTASQQALDRMAIAAAQRLAAREARIVAMQRGIGGRGWRGDMNWRNAVRTVERGGTIEAIDGQIPTVQEALDLIQQSRGVVNRIEGPHLPPNPHQYSHINYTTESGCRGTLRTQ